MTPPDALREAFEQWYAREFGFTREHIRRNRHADGGYYGHRMNGAWRGFVAGNAAAVRSLIPRDGGEHG